ncbi:MAG: SdrD B-like domain-containing protein, partial [Bacteroidota bacterium]
MRKNYFYWRSKRMSGVTPFILFCFLLGSTFPAFTSTTSTELNEDSPDFCTLRVDAGPDRTLCKETITLTANISGQATCFEDCQVNGVQLVKWDLNQCFSVSGNEASITDYSEFDPRIVQQGGCTNVQATDFIRQEGRHSCVDGFDGRADGAVCAQYPEGLNSFVDNSRFAFRTTVTLTPSNNQHGCLTGLRFFEKAASTIQVSRGNPRRVDFPRKYGVRILAGGQEVFKRTNFSTTQDFTLENIDLSSADICVDTRTTFTIEILPFDFTNTGRDNIWEIDDVEIFGGCCNKPSNSNVTFRWSGPSGFIATTRQINVNQVGVYTVNVEDCEGCKATATVNVADGCARVGNLVFNDLNQNGFREANEPGIANVEVKLQRPNGSVEATTRTNNSGIYQFNDIRPGDYKIMFNRPNGFNASPRTGFGDNNVDNNNDNNPNDGDMTDVFRLSAQENNQTIDAGFFEPPRLANVGDLVFNDLNRNGLREPNEPGISGVFVELQNPNGTRVASTTTDANGNYLFQDVPSGSYKITFGSVGGLEATLRTGFGDSNTDNNSDIDPNNLMTDVF